MKIGIFTDTYTPDINGVVSSVVTLKNSLEKNGHEVYVVTTYPGLLKIQRENNVFRLPGIELKFLYGYVVTSPLHLSLVDELDQLQLDLIHVHTEFGIGIFARIVAKSLNIPLVSTYHTTYEDYTHYINFLKLSSIDEIAKKAVANLSKMYGDSSTEVIAPSEKTKEMLLRYKIRSNVHVVPTGLDLDKFNPKNKVASKVTTIKEECGIKEDTKMLLYVGRIAKEKAIDVIIEGFKEVKEKKLNIKFVVVGGGPDLEGLQKLTTEYDLQDYIVFLGRRSADVVADYYLAADAFISASLSETQGVTFIEALASALPVFARKDDVIADLVLDGKTGYYFDEEKSLATCLNLFLDLSTEELKRMQECALEVVKPYDMNVFYDKIMEVYQSSIDLYRNQFKVKSISNKNDYVTVTFTSYNKKETKIMINIDSLIKYGLRKDVVVTKDMIDLLLKEESVVKAYDACLKKIVLKDRSRKEMYDFLTQKTSLDIEDINNIIEKLEQRGLIDDYKYAKGQVYNLNLLLQGPFKISKFLKKKGISIDIIEEVVNKEIKEEDEDKHALMYANKVVSTIKGKSFKMKKILLKEKMFHQGFSKDVIDVVIDKVDFGADDLNQMNTLKKVVNKAYKRYSNKYKGSKLRNNIFRYCLMQGFEVEDIYSILNEMEWDDESKN